MKCVINDLQDNASRIDAIAIENAKEVLALLDSIPERKPFACELIGENGYKLTVGIGKNVGFIQHSKINDDIPYLMALNSACGSTDDYSNFMIGGTLTPIPAKFCFPMKVVKEIIACFVETGERSSICSWESI
jgi:hypothetical protein